MRYNEPAATFGQRGHQNNEHLPSSSVMEIVVTLFPSITSGSDVVSITVKVCSLSSSSSFTIVMFTHLVSLSLDPEVKTSSEEKLL